MKRTLPLHQIRALLNAIEMQGSKKSQPTDRALFLALILCGNDSRTWTWEQVTDQFLQMPHAMYEALKKMAISKKLSLYPFNHERFRAAHWLNSRTVLQTPVFTVGSKPLTTQEVSRRLNRFGRMAGIVDCNLRLIVNTHHLFLELYGDGDAIAEALGIVPDNKGATTTFPLQTKLNKREARLHGIGRRSALIVSG